MAPVQLPVQAWAPTPGRGGRRSGQVGPARPSYVCKSVPQMAREVARIRASEPASRAVSATSWTPTLRVSWCTTASTIPPSRGEYHGDHTPTRQPTGWEGVHPACRRGAPTGPRHWRRAATRPAVVPAPCRNSRLPPVAAGDKTDPRPPTGTARGQVPSAHRASPVEPLALRDHGVAGVRHGGHASLVDAEPGGRGARQERSAGQGGDAAAAAAQQYT